MSSERWFKTASFLSASISWMIFRRHSSTPPWIILAKNVYDILIIKYKCYCKQAMKQMVSWILQYSHIFQLKFTVHQSASFKSCLNRVSPTQLNCCNPSDAGSAALGVETQRKLSSSMQMHSVFHNEETKWSTTLYVPKARQVWSRRAFALEKGWRDERWLKRNCPTQGSKEVTLLPPSQWRT